MTTCRKFLKNETVISQSIVNGLSSNFFGRSHRYLLGVGILNCFYLTKLKFALLSHLPDWMALPHSKCGRMSWNCACTFSSMLKYFENLWKGLSAMTAIVLLSHTQNSPCILNATAAI